jgi:hypothetical protein
MLFPMGVKEVTCGESLWVLHLITNFLSCHSYVLSLLLQLTSHRDSLHVGSRNVTATQDTDVCIVGFCPKFWTCLVI